MRIARRPSAGFHGAARSTPGSPVVDVRTADRAGAPAPVESTALPIARTGLLALLVATTLAFGGVVSWAWSLLMLGTLVLLLMWSRAQLHAGALTLRWTPLYLPVAGFLLLGVVTYGLGLTADRVQTREALVKLAAAVLLFFLAGQLLASAGALRRFGVAATLFCFALSLQAILQFFTAGGRIFWTVIPRYGGAPMGPYVNRNHYAGLMELLLPLGVGTVLSLPRGHRLRPLLAFGVVLGAASLLLSGSRGGSLTLAVEVILFAVVLAWLRRGSRERTAVVALWGIALAIALFLWMDPGQVLRRLATLVDTGRLVEVDAGQRLAAAHDCLRIWRDYPVAGTGLGSFETVYTRYRSFPIDFAWDYAHNDYAQAVAETGLTGGLLILSALLLLFRFVLENLVARFRQGAGWIPLGAAVGCCGLLVHSFVDFNLHIPANAAWFAVAASAATMTPGKSSGTTEKPAIRLP